MHVVGVDRDAAKIEALGRHEIPIYEPGLEAIVSKNVAEGRLQFTTALEPALQAARVVFIAVGTPSLPDGGADLTFIRQVAESIGDNLNGYKVIVTKSTVPTGTGQRIEEIVRERAGQSADFAVVSNPEFLREGSAIDDFLHPERVVIGSRDQRAIDTMLEVYSPLRVADVPFVITNVETAELIKYASNAFLATKISFINEVATLSEALGADVEVVARGMGLDSRIGPKFLHPGPGFGGSCFPKDARAAVQIAHENGVDFQIMEAVLRVNDSTQQRMIEKIETAFGGLEGKTVAVLGLAFKPETDDIRESPALTVVDGLLERGARVRAFDPAAMDACRSRWPQVEFCETLYEAAEGADGLAILTEWNQFRALEMGRLKKLLRRGLIVDLRNIYEPAKVAGAGLHYVSIGRPEGLPPDPSEGSRG
jgi:UDPglucose 6-dehydrogenase